MTIWERLGYRDFQEGGEKRHLTKTTSVAAREEYDNGWDKAAFEKKESEQ